MRRSKRRWVVLFLLVILVAVVALIFWWINSSNEAVIDNRPAPAEKAQAAPAYKNLDGSFVALRYPGTYTVHKLSAKNNDLEVYQLIADTAYSKQLAISVSTLPGGDPANNSAYVLRQARPDLYTKRQASFGDMSATIWASTDGQEQTAFIINGDKIAVLAFTQQGGDTSGLAAEVNTLLQSFRWK